MSDRRNRPHATPDAPLVGGGRVDPTKARTPQGTRPMRMRQYRRNMLRIFRKDPRFATVYAEKLAAAATQHLRSRRIRSGALLLVVSLIAIAAAFAGRWLS